MNTNEELLIIINFLFHDNPNMMKKLSESFSSKEDFLKGLQSYLITRNSKNIDLHMQKLKSFNLDKFQKELKEKGINLLFYHSEAYPELLKNISTPPPLLYYKGQLKNISKELIAVVGPRAVSQYGEMVTATLSKDILSYFHIVSGMAQGVDSIAHSVSLKFGKPTIAVLGTGLDIIYPDCNKKLFHEIAANGLVLSEYPPGSTPMQHRFPQRNRIISGLAKGVLVCEADIKSGALITARLAVDQNREVFAVPGSIYSKNSRGVHLLIQQGAKLVQNVEDIVSEFNYLITPKRNKYKDISTPLPDFENNTSDISQVQAFQLSDNERKVLNFIKHKPANLDEIVINTNLSVHEVLQYLTFFELKDMIQQISGNRFQLKNIYSL